MPIPPEAVLFDMDGTLIDSEPIWFDTEIAILAEYGFDLGREHWPRVLGQPNEVAVGYLLEVSGIPLTARQLNARIEGAMAERMGQGIELVAGAEELFAELDAAGIPAALVTASSRRIVEACIDSIGAHRFRLIVSGDDVVHGKPHPEPYLTAARLLGVDPTRCAVIEDSPNGSRSGAAAGCRVLAIPRNAPIATHPLITVADSLANVSLTTLRGLFGPPGTDEPADPPVIRPRETNELLEATDQLLEANGLEPADEHSRSDHREFSVAIGAPDADGLEATGSAAAV